MIEFVADDRMSSHSNLVICSNFFDRHNVIIMPPLSAVKQIIFVIFTSKLSLKHCISINVIGLLSFVTGSSLPSSAPVAAVTVKMNTSIITYPLIC